MIGQPVGGISSKTVEAYVCRAKLFDNPTFAAVINGETEKYGTYAEVWEFVCRYMLDLIHDSNQAPEFQYLKVENSYYQQFADLLGEDAAKEFFNSIDKKIAEEIFEKAFSLGIE